VGRVWGWGRVTRRLPVRVLLVLMRGRVTAATRVVMVVVTVGRRLTPTTASRPTTGTPIGNAITLDTICVIIVIIQRFITQTVFGFLFEYIMHCIH
jgi:hypothetical protein